MRTLPIVVALQVLTLLAAGYAAFVAARVHQAADAAEARAAAHSARASALAERGRYAAAAVAHRRAAAVARDPAAADAALDAAGVAEAMAVVVADALPPAGERARLEAIVEALAGVEGAEAAAVGLEAVLLRMDGNLAGAAARIEAAEEAGAASPWLDWQMGAVRLQEGRTGEAQARLEKLARAQPTFAPGLHRLGLVYLATDQREAAIGALQRGIEAGGATEVSLDLARLFLGQQMWAEAIPHLERVLRGRGVDVEALRLLAAAHYRLGRHDLAARTYQQAYRADNDPRTLHSAAIALSAGGKQGEALALLDTLMPRVELLPEVAWQRGRILLDLGRVAEGRASLERYLAAAAGRPEEAERVAEVRAFLAQKPAPAE